MQMWFPFSRRFIDRFLKQIDRRPESEGGCWEWTGCVAPPESGDCGVVSYYGQTFKAHRVMWFLKHGPIPAGAGWHGTCVLRVCGNTICVRPRHLKLGTHHDNLGMIKERRAGRSRLQYSEVVKQRRAKRRQHRS